VATLAQKGLIGGSISPTTTSRDEPGGAEVGDRQPAGAAPPVPDFAPLIVAADQEGGIVSHLAPQLTSLPRCRR